MYNYISLFIFLISEICFMINSISCSNLSERHNRIPINENQLKEAKRNLKNTNLFSSFYKSENNEKPIRHFFTHSIQSYFDTSRPIASSEVSEHIIDLIFNAKINEEFIDFEISC